LAVLLEHLVDGLACLDGEVDEELVRGGVDDGVGVLLQDAIEVIIVSAVLRLGLLCAVHCIVDIL